MLGLSIGKRAWYPVDVTDWFPKEITPVYDGVYRTKVSSMDGEKIDYGYSYWKNGLWGPQSLLKDQVEQLSDSANIDFGLKEWRGIAFDPFATYVQPDTLHGQVLRDLAKELDVSEQAVAKYSLALYQMVYEMKKKGRSIIFRDEKGKLTKDYLGTIPA